MTTETISPAMQAFHLAMAEAMRARTIASGPLCRQYTLTVREAQMECEKAGNTPAARRAYDRARKAADAAFNLAMEPIEAAYRVILAAEQEKAWQAGAPR